MGLKEARRRRDDTREFIAKGIDPSVERKDSKAAVIAEQREKGNTFETVAMDWLNAYAPDLSEKQALKLRRYLENVFFPAIGGKAVTESCTPGRAGGLRELEPLKAVAYVTPQGGDLQQL